MRKRFLSVFLAMVLCFGVASQVRASAAATELAPQQVYQAMIDYKTQYPEGTSWTNDNYRAWQGGIFAGGHGCAGFAFMLSDAAFGSLPARKLTQFAFSDVKVGNILRVNDNTHSVIVLEVHDDHVVIAEGNYNHAVHWGRKLTSSEVLAADYMMTRYPDSSQTPAFTDTPSWCAKEAQWAAEQGITKGYGGSATFAPGRDCSHEEILTFLWRAADKPEAKEMAPFQAGIYYQDAVNWAYSEGFLSEDFNPSAPCTRAQAVSYIWKALDEPPAQETANFTDVDAGSPLAGAVSWAVEKKITKGYGAADTFAPSRVCSRGEIACFLYRAYN